MIPGKKMEETERIPKNPKWCIRCHKGRSCSHHRNPNGETQEYIGPGSFEPDSSIVRFFGRRFECYDAFAETERVYECFGYDPRKGFWMRPVVWGPSKLKGRKVCTSSRSIGTTFREVRLTYLAKRLLETTGIAGKVAYELATEREWDEAKEVLRKLDFLDRRGCLTDGGRKALIEPYDDVTQDIRDVTPEEVSDRIYDDAFSPSVD